MEVRESFAQIALPEGYLLGFLLPDHWGRAPDRAPATSPRSARSTSGRCRPCSAAAAVALRPTLLRVGVAVFGALMLRPLVLGIPPFPEIASRIPIVTTANHLRLSIVVMLCLALLAGWGLDDLVEGRVAPRRLLLGFLAVLIAAPVLVLAARGELEPGRPGQALEIAAGSWPQGLPDAGELTAIRMGSLSWWPVRRPGSGAAARAGERAAGERHLRHAGLVSVAGDLFKAGMGANPAIETSTPRSPPRRGCGTSSHSGRTASWESSAPLARRLWSLNAAMRWRLYDARAWDPPVEGRYDRLWRRAVLDGGPIDVPTTSARPTAAAVPARLLW